MSIQRISPDTLPESHGFAHVVVATGTRFVCTSGQVGVDAAGTLVGEGADYRAQARQAAANVYTALVAAGASAADMVRLMIYVVEPTEANLDAIYAGIGEAAREAGAKPTATTLIGVTGMTFPGAVVEFDATALID